MKVTVEVKFFASVALGEAKFAWESSAKQALVEVPRKEPEIMSDNRQCTHEQMCSSGKSTGLRYTKGQYPVLPK